MEAKEFQEWGLAEVDKRQLCQLVERLQQYQQEQTSIFGEPPPLEPEVENSSTPPNSSPILQPAAMGAAPTPPRLPLTSKISDSAQQPDLDVVYASIEAGIDSPQIKLVHKPITSWGDYQADEFDPDEALAGAEAHLDSVNGPSPQSPKGPYHREAQPGKCSPGKSLSSLSKASPSAHGKPPGGKGVGKGGASPGWKGSPAGKGGKGGKSGGVFGSGSGGSDDEAEDDETDDEEDFAQTRRMVMSTSKQLLRQNTSNG
jgi:hypothetical protein